MKLWLVDHSYGAALVVAGSRAEAEEIGDRLGGVSRVIRLPTVGFAFSIRWSEDEEDGAALALESDCSPELDDVLVAALDEHHVALDPEDVARLVGPDGDSDG